MAGASPATTILPRMHHRASIVVAGLAPAMQKCDGHPTRKQHLLKQFAICYNVFNVFFSALRINMTRIYLEGAPNRVSATHTWAIARGMA